LLLEGPELSFSEMFRPKSVYIAVGALLLVAIAAAIVSELSRRSRMIEEAEAQMDLLMSAVEQYRDDNGEFPISSDSADGSKILYQALMGARNDLSESRRAELEGLVGDGNRSFIDPFGQPWQYRPFDLKSAVRTHNNTYDLWSYGNDSSKRDESKWIKNW